MAMPNLDELAKDLFFIKKIKDETIAKMDVLADDFLTSVGSIEHYMHKLQTILDKLPIEERFLLLGFISRHERTMVLFTKMICGIEEILRE